MKMGNLVVLGTAAAVMFSLTGCGGAEESDLAVEVNLPTIDSFEPVSYTHMTLPTILRE